MSLNTRLPALLCLTAGLALAQTWSGFLVNSSCYQALERNRNPNDTEGYVDRDRGSEIRYCNPNDRTKSFAVVGPDGATFTLDAAGNRKAAELVKQTGEKPLWPVDVTGQRENGEFKVSSISLAANPSPSNPAQR
jgi:hypothetical protein